jgi:predicted component of type VI protein secretion system
MPAQLVALDSGPSILLDKPIVLLGRHPECDIQINSRKVSRRHCCIAQVNDYLVVRDLGSTNGIRINGVRIIEGRLNPGDELAIAHFRYKVSWEPAPAAAVPPSSAQPSPPPDEGAKAQGASPKPTVGKSPPLADIEDEMLEAYDEPVALDEPDAEAAPFALPPQSPAPQSPPSRKGKPLYLPEELGQMPNSELFSKESPLASPSGSHPSV